MQLLNRGAVRLLPSAALALTAVCSPAQGQSIDRRLVECRPAPVVANCGTPPRQNGLYRLKSAATFPDGKEICLNVRTQDARYQQFNCVDVSSSHFYFTSMNPDQCYRIEQERSGGRETGSAVNGVGITQIDLTCPPRARAIEWQLVPVPGRAGYFQIKNRQTGKCIDVDVNHLQPGGIVSAQVCQGRDNQYWMLF